MPILTTGAGNYGVAAGSSFATWNPLDKNANLVLTNGNLTVTNNVGGSHSGIRGNTSHTSGKFYYEIFANAQNFPAFSYFGIGNATASISAFLGGDLNSAVGQGNGGTNFNGSTMGPWDGMGATGQTMGIAVDLTTQKIWFWLDATGHWNADILANQNPSTGTGGYSFTGMTGPYFPIMSIYQLNDQFTGNFGATAYTIGTAPTGFGNW